MATRLAKGSRVEVMRRNADDSRTPPYSWRCGDLLSFNSQQFIVRRPGRPRGAGAVRVEGLHPPVPSSLRRPLPVESRRPGRIVRGPRVVAGEGRRRG